MTNGHAWLVSALWLVWLAWWIITAFGTKATVRKESIASRISHVVPLGFGVLLLMSPHLPWRWLDRRFVPDTETWFLIGIVVQALGLAFAIWARTCLGRNWSGEVTLKQGHELIRGGPYALVRHPIYTGILVALLGTAVADGKWRAILGLMLITASFLRKIVIEERFMMQQFGASYARFRAEVPALIPSPRLQR